MSESQIELFRQFVALTKRKRELEAEERIIKKALDKQKELLMPLFEANPRLRLAVDGYTVYLDHRFAAKLLPNSDRARAAEVLMAWVPEMVKPDFNLNTLSSYIREQVDRAGGKEEFIAEMPEAVKQFFAVKDWFDVSARAE